MVDARLVAQPTSLRPKRIFRRLAARNFGGQISRQLVATKILRFRYLDLDSVPIHQLYSQRMGLHHLQRGRIGVRGWFRWRWWHTWCVGSHFICFTRAVHIWIQRRQSSERM